MKNKVFIAGQEGMVGSAIYSLLKKKKFNIINCPRNKVDLTNQHQVDSWFKKNKPNIVINAAGRVGGILDNSTYLSDYIYINTMIGMNIINSSLKYKVSKLINLGSACIYPRSVKQPIKEEYLLSSFLEKTNEGYALAKISCLKYCEYIRKKHNKYFISLQPTNLYGIGDNFNLKSSHVMPALVKKFYLANKFRKKTVEIWGSGKVKREFLNVEDLASAVHFCLKKKISYPFINVGSGDYISIKRLALIIKKISGYKGKIVFNKKYPDGVIERKLDITKLKRMGWKKEINLYQGIKSYYKHFENIADINE